MAAKQGALPFGRTRGGVAGSGTARRCRASHPRPEVEVGAHPEEVGCPHRLQRWRDHREGDGA